MYKKFLIICLFFSSFLYGFEPKKQPTIKELHERLETLRRAQQKQEEPSFASYLDNMVSNMPILSINYDTNNANFDEIRNIPEWQQQFQNVPAEGPVAWHHVLGVSPNASAGEIKKAFHKLSLLVHSDKNNRPTANTEFGFVERASAYTASEKKSSHTIHYTTQNLAKENIRYPVEEKTFISLGKLFGKTEEEKNAFLFPDRSISHWKYYMLAQVATVVGLKKAYNYAQSKEFKAAHPHIAKFSKLIRGLCLMGIARYWPNSLTTVGNVALRIKAMPVQQDTSDVKMGMSEAEAMSKIKIIKDPEYFGLFNDIQKPPLGYICKEDFQKGQSIVLRRVGSTITSGTIGLAGFWITLTALKDLAFGSSDLAYDPFLDDEF